MRDNIISTYKDLIAWQKASKGFSVVEAVLAVSIFALTVTSMIGALIYGQQSTALSGSRSRATFLAEEGIEAVRNIRDEDFTNLSDGNYGLDISSNQWVFSGTSDATEIFTREVIVSTVDANTKSITVNVTWSQNKQRNGLVSLVTYLTDWGGFVTINNTYRVIEYYIDTSFTGTTYDLTLNQDLVNNYFVVIEGSDGDVASTGDYGPDDNYVSINQDPNGTGDLTPSSGSNVIQLIRGASGGANSWTGVVTVVESLGDEANSGFSLLDVQKIQHPNADISGSDTSGVNWTDINQAMLLGGFSGSGCETTQASTINTKACHTRIWPQGSNTINWSRSSIGATLTTATSTVMVIEWGSEWTVQRVNVTGSAGGNGANATSEYNTGIINAVARDNTWVWGTGHTDDQGIGDASEGTLITLGDGVNQNVTESTVAVGQEYSDTRSFEVYTLTHPDLIVDYQFKADGNSTSLIYDISVDTASSQRMALITNGSNGTGNAYPRPMWSARYVANNLVRLERRRSNQNWPAWIQGIDFSNISY